MAHTQHTQPTPEGQDARALAMAGRALFWSQLRRRPGSIRAVAPSSKALARAMAGCVPAQAHRVAEFGAGTGALTWGLLARGIQQEDLALVEPNPFFAAHLRTTLPRAQIVEGYAQDLAPTGDWDAVVSGLPILSFPVGLQAAILRAARGALAPGAPLVQFTYGAYCPYQPSVMAAEGFTARRGPWVGWNAPPARVWILTAH